MVEHRAGLEIDLRKPQVSIRHLRLILDDGGGVDVVPVLEIGIAEELPAVPEIFEIGIARRPDAGAAAHPRAGLDIDRVGDEIDLRAPVEQRLHGTLGHVEIALVADGAARACPIRRYRCRSRRGNSRGSRTAPVFRFTKRYGMPVGDFVKAGDSRSARSFASASSFFSCVAHQPESKPPTMRMPVSNTCTSPSMSKWRLSDDPAHALRRPPRRGPSHKACRAPRRW